MLIFAVNPYHMKLLVIGVAAALLVSCSSGKKPDDEAFLQSLENQTTAGAGVDEEVINSILEQIPSPLEISVLLKESGSKYAPEILNSSNNLPKYNSNYKKALNLGVYGTDLGYTTWPWPGPKPTRSSSPTCACRSPAAAAAPA